MASDYDRHGEYPDRPPERGAGPFGEGKYPHSLGSIIWGALLRVALVMFAVWYMREWIESYADWWIVATIAIYGLAIYPAQVQYDYFRQSNRRLIESTLCSTCRHFRPENLHCSLLDEHISEQYLPCYGEEWEPASFDLSEA